MAVLTLWFVLYEPGASARAAEPNAPRTQAGGVRTSTTDNDLHYIDVHVGTSTVVSSPWPVTRVSITQPNIADVQVLTPRQVLVTGNALGSTDLILWSEDEQVWHARINVLVDLSYIKVELGKLFPQSELDVAQTRDMVVITGRHRRIEDVAHLRAIMEGYGIKYVDTTSVAGVQQVMIHVRVAEASRQALRQLGVNVVYTPDGNTLVSRPAPSNGVPLITFDGDLINIASSTSLIGQFPNSDLQFFLQALYENQYARILAEPTLIAMSGEEASFLAGGEFPIPIVQGGGGSANTSITIEYKEFGVRLKFQPTVLGDNTIRLMVAPEVSDLSEVGSVEIQGFRVPSLLTRRAETTLELHSGQTFSMAGLLSNNVSARNSRIPLLGDIPVLGTLFRSIRYQKGETELLVLVTASLVEPTNKVRDPLVPGDTHVEPSDWEVFIDGRLEGKTPPLSPVDAQWLRDMGLNRLMGPGAWTTHEQQPAVGDTDLPPPPPPPSNSSSSNSSTSTSTSTPGSAADPNAAAMSKAGY